MLHGFLKPAFEAYIARTFPGHTPETIPEVQRQELSLAFIVGAAEATKEGVKILRNEIARHPFITATGYADLVLDKIQALMADKLAKSMEELGKEISHR